MKARKAQVTYHTQHCGAAWWTHARSASLSVPVVAPRNAIGTLSHKWRARRPSRAASGKSAQTRITQNNHTRGAIITLGIHRGGKEGMHEKEINRRRLSRRPLAATCPLADSHSRCAPIKFTLSPCASRPSKYRWGRGSKTSVGRCLGSPAASPALPAQQHTRM